MVYFVETLKIRVSEIGFLLASWLKLEAKTEILARSILCYLGRNDFPLRLVDQSSVSFLNKYFCGLKFDTVFITFCYLGRIF